jgi:hypothetical protein
VAGKAAQREVNALAPDRRVVVVNERVGKKRHQRVIAQAFLRDALRDVNAFNTPFPALLPQREFNKSVLDAFPGEQFPARFRDIPQRVCPVTLDGLLPRNLPSVRPGVSRRVFAGFPAGHFLLLCRP